MSARGYGRRPARISYLRFTYADPAVNVSTEQRTVEHKTIDDKIVVQSLGRKPDQITIEGVVSDFETNTIDILTGLGVVELRTQRWSGDVIVESTSTNFKRARNADGDWLYDVTINCIEVDEERTTDELVSTGSGSDEDPPATGSGTGSGLTTR